MAEPMPEERVKKAAELIWQFADRAFASKDSEVELRYHGCGSDCNAVHHTLHVTADGMGMIFYFEDGRIHKVEIDIYEPLPTVLEFLMTMSTFRDRATSTPDHRLTFDSAEAHDRGWHATQRQLGCPKCNPLRSGQ